MLCWRSLGGAHDEQQGATQVTTGQMPDRPGSPGGAAQVTTGQTGQRLVDVSLVFLPREGYSHTVGYAYARMARVWFLPISVLERVGF